MTVTTTANSITYAGNGTTTAFAFPYVFFETTDLVVTLRVTATGVDISPAPVLGGAATYDYMVTGVITDGEYESGGTVTFNTAPLATHTVSLVRNVPATQLVTLIDNAKFPAATVNVEFDKLTVLAQQGSADNSGLAGVALQIPSNETGLVVVAAPAAARAARLMMWDASGNLSSVATASIIGGSVPAGPASGDLTGTYPAPLIKPSATNGQILTTTGGVAGWATPSINGQVVREVTLAAPAATINLFTLGVRTVRVYFRLGVTVDASTITLRQTTGSTPLVTATYYSFGSFTNGVTTTPFNNAALSSWSITGTASSLASTTSAGTIDIPDITLPISGMISEALAIGGGGQPITLNYSLLNGTGGANGLQFICSSTFTTGSFVRVIGWA